MGREDGEFYMSFQDFKKHFTDFEVCNVSVDQLYEDEKGNNNNIIVLSMPAHKAHHNSSQD